MNTIHNPNKYKVTVGNLTVLLGLFIGIYYILFPGYGGWGYVFAYITFGISLLYFFLDLLLQYVVPKYLYINITESLIDIGIIIWFLNL